MKDLSKLSNSTIVKALYACSADDCDRCPHEVSNDCLSELLYTAARRLEVIGDDCSEERLKELLQAERENRVKILAPANDNTCGKCKHFMPTQGAYGTCAKLKYSRNHYKQEDKTRLFTPARSHKACKDGFEQRGE